MARIISFENKQYSFPDDATDDEISSALDGGKTTAPTQEVSTTTPLLPTAPVDPFLPTSSNIIAGAQNAATPAGFRNSTVAQNAQNIAAPTTYSNQYEYPTEGDVSDLETQAQVAAPITNPQEAQERSQLSVDNTTVAPLHAAVNDTQAINARYNDIKQRQQQTHEDFNTAKAAVEHEQHGAQVHALASIPTTAAFMATGGLSPLAGMAADAAIGAGSYTGEQMVSGDKVNLKDLALNTAIPVALRAIPEAGSYISKKVFPNAVSAESKVAANETNNELNDRSNYVEFLARQSDRAAAAKQPLSPEETLANVRKSDAYKAVDTKWQQDLTNASTPEQVEAAHAARNQAQSQLEQDALANRELQQNEYDQRLANANSEFADELNAAHNRGLNINDYSRTKSAIQTQIELNAAGYKGGVGNAAKDSGVGMKTFNEFGVGKTKTASVAGAIPNTLKGAMGLRGKNLNLARSNAVRKVALDTLTDVSNPELKSGYEALADGDLKTSEKVVNDFNPRETDYQSFNQLQKLKQLNKAGKGHIGKEGSKLETAINITSALSPHAIGGTLGYISGNNNNKLKDVLLGALAGQAFKYGAGKVANIAITKLVSNGLKQSKDILHGEYTPSALLENSNIGIYGKTNGGNGVSSYLQHQDELKKQREIDNANYVIQQQKAAEERRQLREAAKPAAPIVHTPTAHKFHPLTEATAAGIKQAEGAGWTRTTVSVGNGKTSTAYGPYQLTKSTAQAILDNKAIHLTKGERNAMKDLIVQGNKMLEAGEQHPVYGLGKNGDLGINPDFRKAYDSACKKYVGYLLNKYNGDAVMATKAWRFGEDGVNQSDSRYEATAQSARSARGY